MRYDELKDRVIQNQEIEQQLRKAGEREWLCPDGSLIHVRISPQFVSPIYLSLSRWVKQEGAHTMLSNGRTLEGGYHEHQYDLRYLTAMQLEWATKARVMCERYVDGHIAELPDTLF